METPHISSVEPYKYFWLHTKTASQPAQSPSFLKSWGRPNADGEYEDGDHWVGRLREYCIGRDGDILVILEPMWQVKSDDGPLKWHCIGPKRSQYVMKFNDCTSVGEIGKSRARFETKTELLILSSDHHDHELIEELIQGDS